MTRQGVFCVLGINPQNGDQNEHYQHFMFFHFKKRKESSRNLQKQMLLWNVCNKWFSRFGLRNLSVQDAPSSVWSTEINSNIMKELVNAYLYYITRTIVDILQTSKSNVENHLHQLSYIIRCDVWVPLMVYTIILLQ